VYDDLKEEVTLYANPHVKDRISDACRP